MRRYYINLGNYNNINISNELIKSGGLELNLYTKEVKVDGENIKVTPIEYKILELLLSIKEEYSPLTKYMKECGKKKASMLKIL